MSEEQNEGYFNNAGRTSKASGFIDQTNVLTTGYKELKDGGGARREKTVPGRAEP